MQSSNVISFNKDAQEVNQALASRINSYPDIDAIQQWLMQAVQHIEKQQNTNIISEPELWFFYSPYLAVLSEETEYAIEVLAKLCEENALNFTELPENEEIAEACLKSFLHPKREPRVLLIPDSTILKDDAEYSIVEMIHSVMDQSSPQAPVFIVVISSAKQFMEISETLRSAGRLDCRIVLNTKSPHQHAQAFINLIPQDFRHESLNDNIEKLGKLVLMDIAEERRKKLTAIHLIRQAKLSNTKITFNDVVRANHATTIHSYYPESSQTCLEQIAVHECGHAVMAMLTTEGSNIPEYITIRESINFAGIVVNSYHYQYLVNNKPSYKDLLNTIRTLLAGRAATIIYYNLMEYRYAGEFGDFQRANGIARELIEDYGLVPPQLSNDMQYSFCNLRGKETPSYTDHINTQVKLLLDYEYDVVINTLKQHQALLLLLTQTILDKKELFQEELIVMWQHYSENISLNNCPQEKPIFLA